MASVLPLSKLLALPHGIRSLAWKHASRPLSRTVVLSPSSIFPGSTRQYSTENNASAPTSSVNSAEVSHFTTLASSWWDPQGSSRLLHLMNPLRHDFIQQCRNTHAHDPSQQLHYLDIGCGGGIFAESAARLSSTAQITAIDPTPEIIAVAKTHARQDPALLQQGKLQYINTAIENLSTHLDTATTTESPPRYDIVTLFEVIEHIQRPAPFLASCLQHLKPGGWLIGSTIARTNTSWVTTKLVAEDILRIVPRGTHEWSQYIQPEELKAWARANAELDVDGGGWQVMGVVYVPGLGWKEVRGSEDWGNYFFGIRKRS